MPTFILRTLLLFGLLSLFSTLPAQTPPNVSFPADTIFLCSGETTPIEPIVSGGQSPYSYLWSTGQDSKVIQVELAGTYTLTVTDAADQTATASITVELLPAAEVNLSEVICAGETITIGHETIGQPGDYTIFLETTQGCDSIVHLELSVTELTVDIDGTEEICGQGPSGSLIAIVSGGTLPYTYQWSTGATTASLDSLGPGPYIVTVTDAGGCSRVEDFFIVPATVPRLFPGFNHPDCGQANGVIEVGIEGGSPPFTYQWSNGATTPALVGIEAGTYSLTVTDSNGCTAITTVSLQEEGGDLTADEWTLDVDAGCPSLPGTLTLNPLQGTPPFTYRGLRYTTAGTPPDTLIGGPSFTVFPGGSYQFWVTDAEGCTRTLDDIIIETDLVSDPGIDGISCPGENIQLTIGNSSTGPDISYRWTGPGGFLSTESSPVASQPGVYTLRVIRGEPADSCYIEARVEAAWFEEIIFDPPVPQLVDCETYRIDPPFPPQDSFFILSWTDPNGMTGDHFPILTDLSGNWQITAGFPTGSGLNCAFTVTVEVPALPDACATISGTVFDDSNQDCGYNGSESGLAGWVVEATHNSTGRTFYSLTDAQGNYQFYLPLGDYAVTALPPGASWSTCNPGTVISLGSAGQTATHHIPAQYVVSCSELTVDISSPRLRRCFNSYYYVEVCNTGTEVATAPLATVLLDDFLEYQVANPDPVSIDGQLLTFQLPDLEPGQCHEFWIQVLVSCDAVLGQTHCTEVKVTQDSICTPTDPLWSGASLELSADCDEQAGQVSFTLTNTGTGGMTEPVSFIIVEDGVMIMGSDGNTSMLAPAMSETFTYPADGSVYTFQADQVSFHPYSSHLSLSVEGCPQDSGFITGLVTQLGSSTATPAHDILCMENTGAFDPNDKLALPTGYGPKHYIRPGQRLDYTLRFQNTGTDTAFTVVIRDTLSDFLDVGSLQPGPSSHPYRVQLTEARTLVFTFDNIGLVDSFTNAAGSQGFVSYSIAPDRLAPLETRISNRAAIYFDFNEPVITNTVFHTLGENFIEITDWVRNPAGPIVRLQLWPNPGREKVNVAVFDAPQGRDLSVRLFDMQGRLLQKAVLSGDQAAIPLTGLPSGTYLIQLTDGQTVMGYARLIRG